MASLIGASFLGSTSMRAGEPAVGSGLSLTAEPSADKWRYHLFNPVPVALMREMSTDRPDATESPYTVDAGHFQLEASFFDYSRDQDAGASARSWTFGSLNLKAGLWNNVDMQIVLDSYTAERVTEDGHRATVAGFGDVQARLKINLWGNDEGKTALALMPFVKIPTSTALSNGRWEGGVIVPFAFEIMEGVDAGVMVEADFVYDEGRGGYETQWVHTATLGFGLTEKLGAFIEYRGVTSPESGFAYLAAFNTGVTFDVTDNLRLDAGVRLGLNDAAEDYGVFTGFSLRF